MTNLVFLPIVRSRSSLRKLGWIIPDKTIRAHKVILAHFSRFFNHAFTSGMQEEQSGFVKLAWRSPDVVYSIIQWMYGSPLQYEDDKVLLFYYLAEKTFSG
jgi:hypothetical protein